LSQILTVDILCVGGGAAGAMAAVTAAQAGAKVGIMTKDELANGNMRIAGGIVASVNSIDADSETAFADDILRAGEFLSNPLLVKAAVEGSRQANLLLEEWGHIYRRDGKGNISPLSVIKPGGHSLARTLTCENQGMSLATTFRSAIAREAVCCWENTLVLDLVVEDGKVLGALGYNIIDGNLLFVRAKAVILATGGGGMIFSPQTDNTRSATGDGYALGYAAGLPLVDMEQIQWLPFGVAKPASLRGINIGDTSDAGPRGVLVNSEGEVVLRGVATCTRSAVTRTIARENRAGRGGPNGGLFLDATANLDDPVGKAFLAQLQARGVLGPVRAAYGPKAYAWTEPYEVLPTQHFFCGGVQVDADGRTALANLYAVGEVTGGIHGADRLGSVALCDSIVFGHRAAMHAVEGFDEEKPADDSVILPYLDGARKRIESVLARSCGTLPILLKAELGRAMAEKVGCVRDKAGLEEALQMVLSLGEKADSVYVPAGRTYNMALVDYFELEYMLVCAEAVIRCSLAREESRGSHFREDYPQRDEGLDFRSVIAYRGANGKMLTRLEEMGERFVNQVEGAKI